MRFRLLRRTGINDAAGIAPIVQHHIRLTVAVREALMKSGADVVARATEASVTIRLGEFMPAGIVVAVGEGYVYLSMQNEPDWSDFVEAFPDYWCQLDWTPCPKCGAPLVWYEAGYVPGYRVCAKKPHHHVLAR